jgi:bleomycin hydrolase
VFCEKKTGLYFPFFYDSLVVPLEDFMSIPIQSFEKMEINFCDRSESPPPITGRKRKLGGRPVSHEPPEKRQRITDRLIRASRKEFYRDSKNVLLRNFLVNGGLVQAATDSEELSKAKYVFSNVIAGDVAIKDQKGSERCWLFAGLNVLRRFVAQKHGIEDFQFSETYIVFWYLLEKANFFLHKVIEKREEPLESEYMRFLLSDYFDDGGNWQMFANIIRKYGAVPKSAMPEKVKSGKSSKLIGILQKYLKGFAHELRQAKGMSEMELSKRKEEMVKRIYTILHTFLGEPPERFDWEGASEDREEKSSLNLHMKKITPCAFLDALLPDFKIDDQVVLSNFPVNTKPYYERYYVKEERNVVEAAPITWINLPISELKKYALKSIREGSPVWFNSDVGKGVNNYLGVLTTKIFDYDPLFGPGHYLDKSERLSYLGTAADHAMIFTGVNIVSNNISDRWEVENSWGEDSGNNGYLTMTDEWFSENVFEIVIDKSLLSRSISSLVGKRAISVEPWDNIASGLTSTCTSCCSHNSK